MAKVAEINADEFDAGWTSQMQKFQMSRTRVVFLFTGHNPKRDLNSWLGECCTVCKSPTDDSRMLLCENEDCNKMYHIYCLVPPLSVIPDGDWYCPSCVIDQERETGK